MIFGKKETAVDLPVRKLFASSKVTEDPYLDVFATKQEAETYAKKSAQRSDSIYAVYEITLIGSAWPQSSTYKDIE
jgi:hypothetical protein